MCRSAVILIIIIINKIYSIAKNPIQYDKTTCALLSVHPQILATGNEPCKAEVIKGGGAQSAK